MKENANPRCYFIFQLRDRPVARGTIIKRQPRLGLSGAVVTPAIRASTQCWHGDLLFPELAGLDVIKVSPGSPWQLRVIKRQLRVIKRQLRLYEKIQDFEGLKTLRVV